MVTDEKLISDLRDFADHISDTPSSDQMSNSGPWSAQTYRRHFGSWNEAIQAAGLEPNVRRNIPEKELICEIIDLNGDDAPTLNQMRENGEFSIPTYINYFGSWNEALSNAGYEPHKRHGIDVEYLYDQLEILDKGVEGRPRREDVAEHTDISYSTIERNIGSWGNALEYLGYEWSFGEWVEGEDNPNWVEERRGRYYGSQWPQIRSEIIERDDHECQMCGVVRGSDIEHLDVHHIKPYRKFESNNQAHSQSNLVTLCRSCHVKAEHIIEADSLSEFRQEIR